MKTTHLALTGILATLWLQIGSSLPAIQPPRRTLSLDGTWQIAEGKMESVPTTFERTAPVPGLVSLATPPFASPPGPKVAERGQVFQKDPMRDAFWYRRTFRLDTPPPAVALLKIQKAMFGSRAILNGKLLGDHPGSFTPGYFDAKPALKLGENELLIRVGADREAVGPAFPSGFDFEKERYIPGVFDSVELILSGTPHLTLVQVAPDLGAQSVRVQAGLRNDGEAVQAAVTFVVREAKSGRVAGRLKTDTLSLAKGGQTRVDVRVPILNCHLWSPEDPFLYTLEADSGTDRFQTRFGMREFRFDPAAGRAMLNGKPYYMRGSNFTVYRFFEDGECKDLPWRKDWVRLLHRRVKEMHWNCLRYCIGFPPEAWYEAADEAGILIQDEFPIWFGGSGWSKWPTELKTAELAAEYAEWMQERWNHPSVVIWDASNETDGPQMAPAIAQVRGLDLSNRPWDNSYNAQLELGDVFESHPYHFNANFRLRDLAIADPVPQGNQRHNDGQHSVVINEYGWHWVNRDGTPTTLTSEIYAKALGSNATPAQRFHMQATWLAADTEFWRVHRHAAAVVHFTMLGYSRPDGQTCDHWKLGGVEKLEWEPEFHRYVRDAFAPVGLAVDFWKDEVLPQTGVRIPVILINDQDQPWSGPVTLTLRPAGAKKATLAVKRDAALDRFGQATVNFDITWPETLGQYVLTAALRGGDHETVRSVRELAIVDRSSMGLAYGKTVSASSVHGPAYAAANAVDGDLASYWSSTFADPAWLAVDLGEARKIGHVVITWENAYSKAYILQVSRDGGNWTDIHTENDCQGGTSDLRFTPILARHVRIYGTQRATEWGHAIRELQVFE